MRNLKQIVRQIREIFFEPSRHFPITHSEIDRILQVGCEGVKCRNCPVFQMDFPGRSRQKLLLCKALGSIAIEKEGGFDG